MYVDKMNEVSFQKLSEYATSPCVVDKVLLVDNLSKTSFVGMGKGVIVSDFIALLFCTEGNLEIDMDGKHYQLHKGDILFCSQGVALYNIILSVSCKGKVVGISWEYARSLFLRSTCQWNSILQLRYDPLLHPSMCERELYQAYYRLFSAKLNCYGYASDVDCIFQGFFNDLYRMTERYVIQEFQQKKFLFSSRQEDLFKAFITLLKEKYCSEHFCAFYAEQLCVTSKYLTTVVKKSVERVCRTGLIFIGHSRWGGCGNFPGTGRTGGNGSPHHECVLYG